MGAQELKHQVKLEPWKEKMAACRSSGMSVRKWCMEHRIGQKRSVLAAVIKTEKTSTVISESYASLEAIAHTMVKKYVMVPPLYR